jgi:hypothetical protein
VSLKTYVTFKIKITINQNLVVIYHKLNDDFKRHVNFEGHKKKHIALLFYPSKSLLQKQSFVHSHLNV